MAGESAAEIARRHREKIERLQRSEARWQRGADGETVTAAILDRLPDGWTALHDVAWPGRQRANIDHVVVGPAGVFVIDSKNWSGQVVVRDQVLRQNGYRREREVASAAEAALAVARLTAATTVDQVFPVLCVVRDEPLTGWSRDVMVTSTSTLTTMLLSRPQVLHPARVGLVLADLRRGLRPTSAGAPAVTRVLPPGPVSSLAPIGARPPRLSMRAGRRPARPGRARRGRSAGRELRRLAIGLVALTVLAWGAPYLPLLTEPIGRLVTDRLVETPTPGPSSTTAPADATEKRERRRKQRQRELRRERLRDAQQQISPTP